MISWPQLLRRPQRTSPANLIAAGPPRFEVPHPPVLRGSTPAIHVAPNGEIFRIRALQSCDRRRLREGFERASRQTRLQRFFRHRARLSEAELTYLTNVDQNRHVALCAGRVDDRHATGAGVARFIRDADDHGRAEFAITVLDEFQSHGLGTALLVRLAGEARRRGVTELWGQVLSDNFGALRWMQSLGAETRYQGDVYDVAFDVEVLLDEAF